MVGTAKELKQDEDIVREASAFVGSSIGRMLMELLTFPGSVPLDGEALTRLFHRRGINMRYLGQVVKKVDSIPDLSITFFRASF